MKFDQKEGDCAEKCNGTIKTAEAQPSGKSHSHSVPGLSAMLISLSIAGIDVDAKCILAEGDELLFHPLIMGRKQFYYDLNVNSELTQVSDLQDFREFPLER